MRHKVTIAIAQVFGCFRQCHPSRCEPERRAVVGSIVCIGALRALLPGRPARYGVGYPAFRDKEAPC